MQRTLLSFIMPPRTRFAQCRPNWHHVMTPVHAGSGLITLMVSEGKTGFDPVYLAVRCMHVFLFLCRYTFFFFGPTQRQNLSEYSSMTLRPPTDASIMDSSMAYSCSVAHV